ncbi:cation:proton antiporter [Adhaeribacter aerolatus]|uniref:Cation:proton antiporter n=1 Tax=Adhaeribacter aerolatus TaxID=670289 RepID=A0A512B1K7_9BACT|nr:cation:proton antiporter [Adhaeribacter aerolatus]GEO05841.1 cation:proton antiporter [Adhaeribacter aerolatus]
MNLHNYLLYFILPVLSLATILVFIRFIKGPNIGDRIISLDLMVTIGIGAIAVYSMLTGQSTFLDIAMVVALIGFLSTVAFSYYLQKRNNND